VGLFADYFLDRYGREHGQSIAIERSAIKCLEAFSWPGNIRQFENFIARMVITSKTNRISKNAVESLMLQKPRQSKDDARVQEIKKALAQSGGKYQEASAILGIDRSTLWRWLRQYRIDR
jgi:transcriptional regulator of acetoin/glycerol metabolism